MKLGPYVPQIRVRRALAGYLDEGTYCIRAAEVIGRRRHVLTATELRTQVGLRDDQRIILLLFDSDPILERLWDEATHLLPEIADAEFDAVVAPSFSLWTPRARTEHLYNAKRSVLMFQALRMMGIKSIPRVGWVMEQDAQRFAQWVNASHHSMVALDLMTYRVDSDWTEQVELLGLFDQLTGRRVRYLINGPTTLDRFVDIYRSISARRVTLTNATLAAPLGVSNNAGPFEQQVLPLRDGRYAAGREMRARCTVQRRHLRTARRLAHFREPSPHSRRRRAV